MKYFRLITVLSGILCFFSACHIGKKSEVANEYTPIYSFSLNEEADTVSLSQCIDKIEFLTLENKKGSEIFNADKIRFKNNRIYIADFKGNKIVAYDMTGKFLFAIDKQGQGPKEYLEIKSFAVDTAFIYVLDNYNHKVYIYDCHDGSFSKSEPISFVAWDIEVLNEESFIFAFAPGAPVNMKQSEHLLYVTDRDFQIRKSLLPYSKEDKVAFSPHTFFTLNKDSIVYSSLLFDGYTVIPQRNPDSLYHVKFDFERPIPRELRGNNQEINERNYDCLYTTPLICGKYIEFETPDKDFININVYDMQNKRLMQNQFGNLHNLLYYPLSTYENKFVSYVSEYFVYEDLVQSGFNRADATIEQQLKEEGSMLLFYTMK